MSTPAERDRLLTGWEPLDSAAICKEAATKGKHINLAIAFLARRRQCSPEEARQFFRHEIDAYLRRLLHNGQVFRAEHVLRNLGRSVKCALFEYLAERAAAEVDVDDSSSSAATGSDGSATSAAASRSSTPSGSSATEIIGKYLQKALPDYAAECAELDWCWRMLQAVRSDEKLAAKYAHILGAATLEEVYQMGAGVRDQLACDVLFVARKPALCPSLAKQTVWEYLVAERRFDVIVQWLNAKDGGQTEAAEQYDRELQRAFSQWTPEVDMLQQLQTVGVGNTVRDSLARTGVFLSDEQENFPRQLRRICATGAWEAHSEFLESEHAKAEIIKLILHNGFTAFLIQPVADLASLLELREAYPKQRYIIDLCCDLRQQIESQPDAISATVSTHILKSNPNFHKQHPLVYLTELLLCPSICVHSVDATILSQIPLVRVLLARRATAKHLNDQTASLAELIKRFAKIDITQIGTEAAGQPLSFANAALTAKYGAPERLGYLYYVKQSRSAFAVFVFAVEQLQQYAQISRGQIMYACSLVAALAVQRPADRELRAHCVGFMEMLGVDTSALRAYLRCVRLLGAAERADFAEASEPARVQVLMDSQQRRGGEFAGGEYDVRDLDALRLVAEAHNRSLPVAFLRQQLRRPEGNWLRWLAFASYYDYTVDSVLEVLAEAEAEGLAATMRVNLRTALMYERAKKGPRRGGGQTSFREHRKKGQAAGNGRQEANMRTSGETISSSISSSENLNTTKLHPSAFLEQHSDLFALILRCTIPVQLPPASSEECALTFSNVLDMFGSAAHLSHSSTFRNLLHTAIHMKWPIFAVLAATMVPKSSAEHEYCWFVWLSLSTEHKLDAACATDPHRNRALIESSLKIGCLRTLHQSMLIFYPRHSFAQFTEYLHRTGELQFGPETTQGLRLFLVTQLNSPGKPKTAGITLFAANLNLLDLCVALIMQHLQFGFQSAEHRQQLLGSLCESGISDHTCLVDFCTLKRLHDICSFTAVAVRSDQLVRNGAGSEAAIQTEYERLRERLVVEREFAKALQLADLLQMPRDSIIYEWWVAEHEAQGDGFDLGRCEREIGAYSLAPELVITFYTHVAGGLPFESRRKYAVLKRIMSVIKTHRLFPNDGFNCDRIEYDMVMAYLRGPDEIGTLDVYYSDYFETIMCKERGVLYKSFAELKEISGIEDLTVSNKRRLTKVESERLDGLIYRLLDDGDIVQALRLQAIFLHRPLDLHYLVFCMALAEGLASLTDLSPEQEQMTKDARMFAMARFNRRRQRPNSQSSNNSSPHRPSPLIATTTTTSTSAATAVDISASSATLEFEEIPSRHKQDILAALQNFSARIRHGTRLAQRITQTWRAAMYLDKEYADVLRTKDAYVLLESAIADDCMYKLDVMHDIMDAMRMTRVECADFLADKIATSVIRAQFYMLPQSHSLSAEFGNSSTATIMNQSANSTLTASGTAIAAVGPLDHTLWGYDLDREFRLFLDLCSRSTATLGNNLLQYCDALRVYRKFDAHKCPRPEADEPAAVRAIYRRLRDQTLEQRVLSHKKQNTISVELLIKAHECFVHECYMEGIACVLHRTRIMCTVLTQAKSWSLIVRMLMGVGRYREMYYCFETLIRHDQFESLLGQFDADRIRGLNQACVSYLRECGAENTGEYFRLAALHFRMYKEIGRMWEEEAKAVVAKVLQAGQVRGEAVVSVAEGGDANGNEVDGGEGGSLIALHLRCSPDVASQLTQAMDGYAHATENYLIDNKLALAQQTASMAELVALQIYLVRQAQKTAPLPNSAPAAIHLPSCTCICVVNIPSAAVLKHFVNSSDLSVAQSMILGRAYPFQLNWTDALYSQYIVGGNERYLRDFGERMQLTEPMIEALVRQFQQQQDVTVRMELAIARLVERVETVTTRYRLASVLGLKRCVAALINDQSLYYLRDTNYGRSEAAVMSGGASAASGNAGGGKGIVGGRGK